MEVGHDHERDRAGVGARAREAARAGPCRARFAAGRPRRRGGRGSRGARPRPRGEGSCRRGTSPALGWVIRKAGHGYHSQPEEREVNSPVTLQRTRTARRGARSSRRELHLAPGQRFARRRSRPRARPGSGSVSGFGSAWTFIGAAASGASPLRRWLGRMGGQRSGGRWPERVTCLGRGLATDKLRPMARAAHLRSFAPGCSMVRSAWSPGRAAGSAGRPRSSSPARCDRGRLRPPGRAAGGDRCGDPRGGRERRGGAARHPRRRGGRRALRRGRSSGTAASTCWSTTPAVSS